MFDFLKPVLSDRTIMKYNKKGLLIEQPIKSNQLQPNSVDLTLAKTYSKLKQNYPPLPEGYRSNKSFVNPRFDIIYEDGKFDEGWIKLDKYNDRSVNQYVLEPGEFVLMASNEILNIPNGILSFVQGRSSIARLGIQTEQAGLIDAGFRGTITFEIFNQSEHSIILYEGMRIAQVYFFRAQKAMYPYGSLNKNSKYKGQIHAKGSCINLDPELYNMKDIVDENGI